jgi:PDZ domain-containing protein
VQYFVPVTGAEVVLVETDSNAWNTGFRKGDIIRSLNQEPVTSPERLLSMMRVSRPNLLFNIVRNGDGIFLVVPVAATRKLQRFSYHRLLDIRGTIAPFATSASSRTMPAHQYLQQTVTLRVVAPDSRTHFPPV